MVQIIALECLRIYTINLYLIRVAFSIKNDGNTKICVPVINWCSRHFAFLYAYFYETIILIPLFFRRRMPHAAFFKKAAMPHPVGFPLLQAVRSQQVAQIIRQGQSNLMLRLFFTIGLRYTAPIARLPNACHPFPP